MLPDGVPTIEVDSHPLLDLHVFITRFPSPLAKVPTPGNVLELLALGAPGPMKSDDAGRAAIRDLLRHGGYKPTGRGKPSSEYLIRAASEGTLKPVNVAVDAGNAISLHTGIPVSVVDLDHLAGPLAVRLGRSGDRYVFNASGQVIDVEGLPCLFDSQGPCANAVKDAQRTKTHEATKTTLSLLWGSVALGDRTARAARWYREVLDSAGATTAIVVPTRES